MFDIVCYYADLGRPYEPLIERMTGSARRVMPDARLVLLTPNAGEEIRRHFDTVCQLPPGADETNLCLERVRAVVSWQMVTQRISIHCDPDLEWKRRPGLIDGALYNAVGLLWRAHKPDQPVNTGMIIATPGAREFWQRYGSIAVNLPPEIHSWWCDQLAFALITGVDLTLPATLKRYDADVCLINGKKFCPAADEATEEAWALHYKGALKEGDYWRRVYKPRVVNEAR